MPKARPYNSRLAKMLYQRAKGTSLRGGGERRMWPGRGSSAGVEVEDADAEEVFVAGLDRFGEGGSGLVDIE